MDHDRSKSRRLEHAWVKVALGGSAIIDPTWILGPKKSGPISLTEAHYFLAHSWTRNDIDVLFRALDKQDEMIHFPITVFHGDLVAQREAMGAAFEACLAAIEKQITNNT